MTQIKHSQKWNHTRVKNGILEDDNASMCARMAYIALCYFADHNNECFPSYAKIAKKMGGSRSSAINGIKELLAAGWINKEERIDQDGDNTSNLYTLFSSREEGENDGGVVTSHTRVVTSHTRGGHDTHPNNNQCNKNQLTITSKGGGNETVKAVIDYLNEKAGRKFRYTANSIKFITARLNEGFVLDDFKSVIASKVDAWGNDPKMNEYLRPQTLFAPSKFEGYLNAAPSQKSRYDDMPTVSDLIREW